jgi:hypothetical protein
MNHRRPVIIGVMGGASADENDILAAYRLGKRIAENGWILLNGGRNAGIMEASAKGAKDGGGTTIGILPGSNFQGLSQFIDIPILTGMGSARNCINVLSSHVVVACPGGPGTLSEIALALKFNKPVILFNFKTGDLLHRFVRGGPIFSETSPEAVIATIRSLLEALPIDNLP